MIRTIAFYCCLFTAATLYAQPGQGDLRLGFQLSPTFSWMNTNDNLINSDGTNLGLKTGLLAEFFFQENYSISTGLNFHFNAGGTLFYEDSYETIDIWNDGVDIVSDTSFSGGTAFKYGLQFLEIPLGLTLRTREFGYLRYYVRPAVTLGILTQSRGEVKNTSFIDPEESFD
ncbi:MAG: outer membrane beta-barrel protein, partial [Bacteroidota bacterium]